MGAFNVPGEAVHSQQSIVHSKRENDDESFFFLCYSYAALIDCRGPACSIKLRLYSFHLYKTFSPVLSGVEQYHQFVVTDFSCWFKGVGY